MRTLIVSVLALTIAASATAPALAAEDPAEAQAGLNTIRETLRAPKVAKFRKVKVNAAGDVCATVSVGADEDTEVRWTKATGQVWANEAPTTQQSGFIENHPNLRRSDDRADFIAWRNCQKGK